MYIVTHCQQRDCFHFSFQMLHYSAKCCKIFLRLLLPARIRLGALHLLHQPIHDRTGMRQGMGILQRGERVAGVVFDAQRERDLLAAFLAPSCSWACSAVGGLTLHFASHFWHLLSSQTKQRFLTHRCSSKPESSLIKCLQFPHFFPGIGSGFFLVGLLGFFICKDAATCSRVISFS